MALFQPVNIEKKREYYPMALFQPVNIEKKREYYPIAPFQPMPGLDRCLPAEAHREHACRARADTAGRLGMLGQHNAPALASARGRGGSHERNGTDRPRKRPQCH